MKELSIEQKAKRYDETIEKLRNFHRDYDIVSGLIDVKEELANLFPELKESEDEKIRKDIISALKWANHKGVYDKHIAWLEKQGRHSIYNVPSQEVILTIWDLGNEWKELTNGSISTEYGTQLDYIQKHWRESEYYLREKQVEQKPADKVEPKFKAGDKVLVDGKIYTIKLVNEDNYIVDENGRDVQEHFSYTKDWKLYEQNPANWSKEDEKIYQSIMDDTVQENQLDDKQILWLKSLKDRVQPKQKKS